MSKEHIVLCGANSYEEKYYFNEDFSALPQYVQDELHIMCVLFTQDVGGVLLLEFDEEGSLLFQVEAVGSDGTYDEIGSGLKIKEIQRTKKDFLKSLELYFRVFFLGEVIDDEA